MAKMDLAKGQWKTLRFSPLRQVITGDPPPHLSSLCACVSACVSAWAYIKFVFVRETGTLKVGRADGLIPVHVLFTTS